MDTYLNKEQLDNLAEVFANEEQFAEHLKTLWALRSLLYNKIEAESPNASADHPLYRIFDLTNKMINAIDDGTISIVNGRIRVDKNYKWR